MSYVDPNFTNTYKNHQLFRLPGCANLDAFQLVEPGSGWIQSTVITFYGPRPEWRRQICITGDLCPGQNHGVLSNWGYGLEWFASQKGENYLCEKFLRKEWRPEKCLAWLEEELSEERKLIAAGEHAENDDDYREASNRVEKLQAIIFEWEELLEEEGPTGIHHRFYRDLGQGSVDDGLPGMGYAPRDAGLLCAAQQAFARLYPTLPPMPSEPML